MCCKQCTQLHIKETTPNNQYLYRDGVHAQLHIEETTPNNQYLYRNRVHGFT